MAVTTIRDGVYAVGAVDHDIRVFHGYETPYGTSYNAYLVVDGDDVVLIDFVKEAFTGELLRNIEEICPVRKITHMVCNHIEPDHSGALPVLADRLPEVPIHCTAAAAKGLRQHYGREFNCRLVKLGNTLKTKRYTFSFVPAPMVHWPDSMMTHLAEEKILFSNDAFGQHIAAACVFDNELGRDRLMERAGDYYANIVLPFGAQVAKVLGQAAKLDIDVICPSHGMIVRTYIPDMIEAYTKWSANVADENKAVIVYDTMWGATRQMAHRLYREWTAKGKRITMLDLGRDHISKAMKELLDAKYVFVGSSTLNRQMLPTVAGFLAYMKGLAPKGRVGMAFGSYGWSGESVGQVEQALRDAGWDVLESQKMVYMGYGS